MTVSGTGDWMIGAAGRRTGIGAIAERDVSDIGRSTNAGHTGSVP